MAEVLLAFDIGTSALKACLVDSRGCVLACAAVDYPTGMPFPGWAEQDPMHWWSAAGESCRQVLATAEIHPCDIRGIGISGHMMGVVALDAHYRPAGPAWLHSDRRSHELCADLARRMDPGHYYRITGNRLDAHYPFAKYLWLRQYQHDVFQQTRVFVQSKDFLAGQLTGWRTQPVTDFSDAALSGLFDIHTRTWSPDLAGMVDFPMEKLPPVCASSDVIGAVCAAAANHTGLAEGTPVCVGGGDGVCATLGAGIAGPGHAYANLGTTAWISMIADAPHLDAQARTFSMVSLDAGSYEVLGVMQCAGASYQWMAENIAPHSHRIDHAEIERLAAGSPAGARGLLFLPWLEGERTPLWDPLASGGWLGLTARHTRTDMMRSTLEGIGLALRSIMEILDPAGEIGSLSIIGGLAQCRLFSVILAEMLGRSLTCPADPGQATAIGAALCAGVGVGLFADWRLAAQAVSVNQTITPDGDWQAVYDQLFAIYTRQYETIRQTCHQLAALHQ
jgi:xylulokinase